MEDTNKMDNEKVIGYKKLDKSAKSCMRISAIIMLGIFLIGSIFLIIFVPEIGLIGKICVGALWVVSIAYILLAPNVRYERYRYAIDEEAIRVRKGFLWISEETVPMERLHKIKTSQGPVARMFKLSTINVTTAGGDVDIQFLKEEEAAEITELLKKKINEIAIKEREH